MKIFGILIAGMLLLTTQVLAQAPNLAETAAGTEEHIHFGWADVLRVDPVYDEDVPSTPQQAAGTAQQECYEEQVPVGPAMNEADNGKRTVATVFGAIIGGLLGNRVGQGNGRKAATAAGAVAGGVVGNNLAAQGDGRSRQMYTTQRHCRPAGNNSDNQRRAVAYDVEYRYRGEVYNSRLPYDPGDRMRVRVSVAPAQ